VSSAIVNLAFLNGVDAVYIPSQEFRVTGRLLVGARGLKMARGQKAIVVVDREWINTAGINHLLARGRQSAATGGVHMIIAPLEDASNHQGLWLSEITTTALTQDASVLKMKFMIPWSVIRGLGVVDEPRDKPAIGFKSDATTLVLNTASERE
jgi:hypothetical protein